VLKVWVARDEPAGGPLCRALAAAGLEPVCEPVVERRLVGDVAAAIAALGPEDWLVLTSRFAVESIPAARVKCRVAVVGDSSLAAAKGRGLRVERVSPDGTGAGLWRSLRESSEGARQICYPRSSLADVPMAWPGIKLDTPVLYEVIDRTPEMSRLVGVPVAALTSPSAVAGVLSAKPGIRCASIGPTTSASLRARGVEPWLVAPGPSFESLARAIAARAGDMAVDQSENGSSRHHRA
jgi:uroporphyrinogen-III synthase